MWNKELIKLLITKYREHDILYNFRDPNYMNRVKRSNALFQIWTELQVFNKDITVTAIKQKIHTLRTQFTKEARLLARSKRSGVGADDLYEPKLWCFAQLNFLQPHCGIRKSLSNVSERDEDAGGDIDDEEPAPQPSTQSRCNKRKSTTKFNEQVASAQNFLLKRLVNRRRYDWLGKQVIFGMDSLKNDAIRRETAWKIQKILRGATLQDEASQKRSSSKKRYSFTPIAHSATTSYSSSSDIMDPLLIMDDF